MAQPVLEPRLPGDARARALRREFVDHVRAVLGAPPLSRDDPLDDGDPALDADLAPPGGAFWLAVLDGRDVGCVGARSLGSGTAELKRMYVVPAARGTGVGQRLLTTAEAWAGERGARRVVLDTSSALHAACRLYRAAGYHEVAAYNANPDADLWFARELAPGAGQ